MSIHPMNPNGETNMRPILILTLALLLISVVFVGEAQAAPVFATTQTIDGYSIYRTAFLTAWNLSSGALSVSQTSYHGLFWLDHPAPPQQWIARFIYDEGSGKTRELAWHYTQPHVQ